MSTTYPAGWYPDQNAPGTERYYDGAGWTEHSRPVVSEPLPTYPDATPTQAYQHAAAPAGGVYSAPTAILDSAAQAPVPKKRKNVKVVLIVLAVLVAFIILVNAISSGGADEKEPNAAPVAEQPAAEPDEAAPVEEEASTQEQEPAEESPAEEPVEQEAPEADAGEPSNPMSFPHRVSGWLSGEKYEVSVKVANPDANASIAKHNMFNKEAPAGYKWVIVQVVMTGIDKDGIEPRYEQSDIKLATMEGNTYDSEWVTFSEGTASMYDGPTLYPGQSFTGLMAFIVPADAKQFLIEVDRDYFTPAG